MLIAAIPPIISLSTTFFTGKQELKIALSLDPENEQRVMVNQVLMFGLWLPLQYGLGYGGAMIYYAAHCDDHFYIPFPEDEKRKLRSTSSCIGWFNATPSTNASDGGYSSFAIGISIASLASDLNLNLILAERPSTYFIAGIAVLAATVLARKNISLLVIYSF